MLATFIIGLREGLEAALIVSIIAAFLRRNGRSLVSMWIGVGAAIAASLAVGIALRLVEKSLPQAAQEGMETIIGGVAVVFVTGMIVWMAKHSRGLKREIESSAQDALGDGSTRALVIMAFLAVLREGFETAVFLLATFQAAGNGLAAVAGAVLGIGASVLLGWGLYSGGVRLNLGKFFKGTSVFLVLVAAGLVVNAFRTAHEAGWLLAGQQRTVDLSWLSPNGSVRSALITGVLGIPSDPRVVEVVGWFAYLIPMCIIMFWPAAHRPAARAARAIKHGIAASLLVGAAVLAFAVPIPSLGIGADAAVQDASGASVGTAHVDGNQLVVTTNGTTKTVALGEATTESHAGLPATHYSVASQSGPTKAPSTLTIDDLMSLNRNRLPVGFNAGTSPGPYAATWGRSGSTDVWVTHGVLLAASNSEQLTVTLSGGGLSHSRTLSVPTSSALAARLGYAGSWQTDPARATEVSRALTGLATRQAESHFWGRILPIAMALAALVLMAAAERTYRRGRRDVVPPSGTSASSGSHVAGGATVPVKGTTEDQISTARPQAVERQIVDDKTANHTTPSKPMSNTTSRSTVHA